MGGVLPACKNTAEIAGIRGVEPYTQINSPATHSAFSTPLELMKFIQKLRNLSSGKPVGFKLCIGQRSDFIALCKAMLITGIKPDFITVDGGEGGTGAAPLEYTNSIGMPLTDALAFAKLRITGNGEYFPANEKIAISIPSLAIIMSVSSMIPLPVKMPSGFIFDMIFNLASMLYHPDYKSGDKHNSNNAADTFP